MFSFSKSEKLSRFVFSSNEIRSSDNSVRHNAFMPNSKNGKTSVFRISEISDNEIWVIGNEVSEKRKKPIKGRADINASNILSKGLDINPSEPPVRHADITSWPSTKSEQKLIAVELASESQLKIK